MRLLLGLTCLMLLVVASYEAPGDEPRYAPLAAGDPQDPARLEAAPDPTREQATPGVAYGEQCVRLCAARDHTTSHPSLGCSS